MMFNNNDTVVITFKVPIVGWDAGALVSENELSQQIIEAKATSATTTIGTSATTIINGTEVYDSHNAYDTSTGQFTAPRSGTVIVGFSFIGGNVSSSSANTGIQATVYVAGSPISQIANFRYQVASVALTTMGVGRAEVPVTKGQTVDVRMFRAAAVSSTSLTGASDYNYVTFYMKPTVTTLGVVKSPKIRASGLGNGGTSLTGNTTNIDFTEISGSDTNNAWNGTQFTAPKPGYYKAKGSIALTAGVAGLVNAYIDGSLSRMIGTTGNDAYNYHTFSWEGKLNKDQVLSIRFSANATLSNSSTLHWIEIASDD